MQNNNQMTAVFVFIGIAVISWLVYISIPASMFVSTIIGPVGFVLVPPIICILIGCLVWLIILAIRHHKKIELERKKVWQDFAQRHELGYEESGSANKLRGRLFNISGNECVTHSISGIYRARPTKIFNYAYVVKQGKRRYTYPFTVVEVEFTKTRFPYILLHAQSMQAYTKGVQEITDTEIVLEQDFAGSFKLFATRKYEIEVLQIFSPETLTLLLAQGGHISIEFVDNKMYFYDDKEISDPQELQAFFDVTQKIVELVGARIDRLHDDFAVMHKYYRPKS